METLAQLTDYVLLLLIALTCAIITFKTIELYAPRWIGRKPLAEQLGTTPTSQERAILGLEAWLTPLAVIATTAPFVGLIGTVMHIISALRGLGTGIADMALISGPIATALTATLLGLCSAIPAQAAVALFNRRIDYLAMIAKIDQKKYSDGRA